MTKRILALSLIGACGGGGAKTTDTTTTPPVSNTAVAMDDEPVAGSAEHAAKPVDAMDHDEAVAAAQAAGVLGNPNAGTPPAGPLDKDAIRAVVRANVQAITFCYEKRLIEVPDLQGTTTVTFMIGTDGKVLSSTGEGFDPAVDTCVADLVKTFVFPAPDAAGTLQVRYPFKFKPVS